MAKSLSFPEDWEGECWECGQPHDLDPADPWPFCPTCHRLIFETHNYGQEHGKRTKQGTTR